MIRIVFLMIVALPFTSFGQGFSKVGTAAAQFLKIGIGARPTGMGESFGAVANDVNALYWNPAGILNVDRLSVAFSHTKWLGEMSHNFAGVVIPMGEMDAFGVSMIMLSTSEQEVTTVSQPEGTGVFYSVNDLAIGLSYARALTDRFSVGMTAKYVQQNMFNESASTFALDVGTYLKTGFHNLVIAMSVSNFGGNMQLDGRDLIILSDIDKGIGGEYNPDSRLKTEPWSLPLNFRVGVAMDLVGQADALVGSESHRVTMAVDGNHPNDNNERLNIGSEYAWSETFFLRVGYKMNYDIENWTFGTGIHMNVGNQTVAFDYALVDYNDFGKVSKLTLELKF